MTQAVTKHLVVCADDYALNAPVSQGIVTLARMRRLSATSVMSLSPRWAEDAIALRELHDQLDVGLHLDWTSTFAIEAGHGSNLGRVMVRAQLQRYKKEALQDLIERQLDAFELHWQAAPSHIDGHQHIHQFAVFREALAEVLLRRYGTQTPRPWVRIAKVAQAGLKAKIINAMGATALHQWTQANDWPCVSPLLGAYGFDGDTNGYGCRVQQWLAQAPTRAPSLLMCHPAVSAQTDDAIGPARVREFAYLASRDFVRDLHHAHVRLVRGSGTAIALPDGAS